MANSATGKLAPALAPFVLSAASTRMPMVVTSSREVGHPIVFANKAFLDLTGYSCDDLQGRQFAAFLVELIDPSSPDRMGFLSDLVIHGSTEVKCRRKDGSSFIVVIYPTEVFDAYGGMANSVCSFVDITEYRHAEEMITMSFEDVLRRTPGFIATSTGRDHRFSYANLAYHQLVMKSDIVGRTVADVLPEMREQGILDILDAVFDSGERYIGKGVRMTFGQGPEQDLVHRYLDFVYEPMRAADGHVTGLLVEGHDVTPQKLAIEAERELQTQLVHYSRLSAMGTLAATLAHEIHQPLATMSNYAAACARHLEQDTPNLRSLKEGVAGIVEGGDRARTIIRRLKMLIKRGQPVVELIDLTEALQSAVLLALPGACEGTHVAYQRIAPIMVRADSVQIQQVVINLVRNACEAVSNSEVKRVIVSAEARGTKVLVSVDDTGVGLPPGREKSLFEWHESSKPEGTGIGLAIARGIIEAHDGEIWIDKKLDTGTRICFSLPLASG